jgi:hypothetical protein
MARTALPLGVALVAACGFHGRPGETAPPDAIDAAPIDAAPLCISYVPLGTSKYRFVAAPSTPWAAAEADCADDEPGATHLVAIADDTEREVVGDVALSDAWVGLDDLAVNNTWQWIIGGVQPATRPPWKGGEPSGGPQDNCAMLDNSAELDAKNCGEAHAYVCECDGKPPRS